MNSATVFLVDLQVKKRSSNWRRGSGSFLHAGQLSRPLGKWHHLYEIFLSTDCVPYKDCLLSILLNKITIVPTLK